MKGKSKESMLQAYTKVYKRIQAAGLHVDLQFLDNECSQVVSNFLTSQGATKQLVPPNNHRSNAAERAIQTAKCHLISGLCTAPSNFPLPIWDKLIPQAELTLNLLRGSRMNPKLSAWAQFDGPYDFNRTPIAPPGINVLVYVDPDHRGSWGSHAIEGHYIGPALEHYRCYDVYIPSTKAVRTTDTLVWLPEKIPMPGASSTDIITNCLIGIKEALENPSPNAPVCPLQPTQIETLQQLIDIFQATTADEDVPAAHPRVSAKDPAQLPRVPDKQHRYPTRGPPPLPPACDSAYFVEESNVPLPQEGETSNRRKWQ
jgi:hypothetical protein